MTRHPVNLQADRTPIWGWWLLFAFAVAIYAFGLGGQYIPTNGDEMVYTHIARLTAASGQWLPLVSDLDHMRNTKPPLLFWQAIVAGDWGGRWQMWALRTPSLTYTLLLTAAIGWSTRLITRSTRSALLAACVYLAFFCTFRYGRPFLTSAPETFWLSVPMFGLLWLRLQQTNPDHVSPAASGKTLRRSLLTSLGCGLALGLGLAYKSFALIAPAAAAWWCAEILSSSSRNWRSVLGTTLRVGTSSLIALGVFGLWFALDPDPGAVWREFVVGENAGKLSNSQGYWHMALSGGGSSIWAQLLAYVQNAGLLAFVILGLMWTAWQTWRRHAFKPVLSSHLWVLLAWLLVWLLVFTLPSQRSARYVIPAMPALAMLVALYWTRIARGWFLLSLILSALLMLVLGRIGWVAHVLDIANRTEFAILLLALALGGGAVLAGIFNPAWTRTCTLLASLTVLAIFNITVQPLDGPAGNYAPGTVGQLKGLRIAVPNGFNGQFERFEFLLPGNHFVPYEPARQSAAQPTSPAAEIAQLMSGHDAVVWAQSSPSELEPPCAPDCRTAATRWHLKGRHQAGEINLNNLWYPQEWLFRREWLVMRATSH